MQLQRGGLHVGGVALTCGLPQRGPNGGAVVAVPQPVH